MAAPRMPSAADLAAAKGARDGFFAATGVLVGLSCEFDPNPPSFSLSYYLLQLLIAFVVLLRLGWRLHMRGPGLDDLFMGLAWVRYLIRRACVALILIFVAQVFLMGYLGEIVLAKHNGLGHYMAELTFDQMTIFLKVNILAETGVRYPC